MSGQTAGLSSSSFSVKSTHIQSKAITTPPSGFNPNLFECKKEIPSSDPLPTAPILAMLKKLIQQVVT